MDNEEKEKIDSDKIETEFSYDSGSKLNNFVARYGGATIGGVIALLLCVTGLYRFLFCLIIILIGAFAGDYIQKNRVDVKQKLKDFIDKF